MNGGVVVDATDTTSNAAAVVSIRDDIPNATEEEEEMPKGKMPKRVKEMYTTSDYWTLWIGLLSFVLATSIVYIIPFESKSTRAKYIIPQPMKWDNNPLDAWDVYNLVGTVILLAVYFLFYGLSLYFMNKLKKTPLLTYVIGFTSLCFVSVVAFWIGRQSWCSEHGFGYAIWSIVLGMIIGNTPLTKGDRLSALKHVSKDGEYFIKCSLVLLAVEFTKLGQFGLPAFAVAWIASPIALIVSYNIGTRLLHMDAGPSILISTGATWCGASAISAVSSVITISNSDVVASIGIVAAATVVFTFLQPYFAMLVGMDDKVAGAWIGGSVDQTGNVIASAAIISDEATEVAGIVKIILNSALGILVTIVAFWWQTAHQSHQNNHHIDQENVAQHPLEPSNQTTNQANKTPINKNYTFTILFLWDKFPKFVIGYLLSCLALSFLVHDTTPEGQALQRAVHTMSKWWFCIAFVAIGITTNLVHLYQKARSTGVIKLYFISNTIDILLAYLLAWLMF